MFSYCLHWTRLKNSLIFLADKQASLLVYSRVQRFRFTGIHDETKVLQYFTNVMYNSAAQDTFTQVVNLMKNSGLWDDKLAWYSLITTCQIWPDGLGYGLGIHKFRSYRRSCCNTSKMSLIISWTIRWSTAPSPFAKGISWLLPRHYGHFELRNHKLLN